DGSIPSPGTSRNCEREIPRLRSGFRRTARTPRNRLNLRYRPIQDILLPMSRMRWFFVFFFLSGLCSLLYEVIWLRLGMAQFGVTTALISVFLSIFLAGLGLGSWGFGKLARRLEARESISFLRGYAAAE